MNVSGREKVEVAVVRVLVVCAPMGNRIGTIIIYKVDCGFDCLQICLKNT